MAISGANRFQRLEETFGAHQVSQWAQEEMPVDAMGTPSKMEQYRQEGTIQRSAKNASPLGAETTAPDAVHEVLESRGRPLPDRIQSDIEDRMDASFGDVTVHTGAKAADACDAINARAFTVGNHIAFNTGEYDPASPEGQHVLAHELAHVEQQTGGAISMLPQDDLDLEIDPDPQLEREAEETAQRVMEGGELGVQRLGQTEVHVQRVPVGEDPYGEAHDEFIEKQKERLHGEEAAAAGVETGALLEAFRSGGIEALLSVLC
ncbi:DUF4157 domain-containing protein [Haloarcula onubensis]|uniref:DUF4157 domain-containing protein n=1 Tax=Haloarcula onubensis TaxID=2950539 RepID=A0ABU2FT92_9EURY|nr:DUF4157 domain-containing protein [Halomicroarcula sp. S3CR25-11]MDS0283960.1 DUF4157 domain-containing protein [Halomicroarcula sp. S3CR25-11]